MMQHLYRFLLSLTVTISISEAWIIQPSTQTTSPFQHEQHRCLLSLSSLPSSFSIQSTQLHMAGFGSSSNTESKEVKLKPKQQWDRYIALKKETSVKVGVKVVNTNNDNNESQQQQQWMEVGAVKYDTSIPDLTIDIAVARQRALIVEHAKRLYPLQISVKAQIEWGYLPNNTINKSDESSDNEEGMVNDSDWIVVDKAVLETLSSSSTTASTKSIEKYMGFEGIADPTTGYYCVYNEGRLVKDSTTATLASQRPSSKKIS